jgi:acyl-CoA synthetase (AMP-forming)/AMP-acid ligase II
MSASDLRADAVVDLDLSQTAVDHTTMGGMLRWQAVHRPDDVAVVCGGEDHTWAGLNEEVNRCAHALHGLGLVGGDNVAVMMANSIDYVVLYLAAAKIGVSVTPINSHFAGREVAHVINDSAATLVLHDVARSELLGSLVRDGSLSLPADRVLSWSGPDSTFGALTRDATAAEPTIVITGDERFFIGYTSGTTGFPKGCVQTHRKFVAHYRLSATHYAHGPGEVMLIPGPLFHEAPTLFLLAHLFAGGTIVLMAAFDPRQMLRDIEHHRCTSIGFAVPTMLDRVNEIGETHDTSSVRQITTGGAPLHGTTLDATLATFANAELHEFYGATEIGLATTVAHRAEGRAGSCGRAFPGISVAIFDDAGEPVGAGERGLVYITPLLMEGYLNNPAATEAGTVVHGGVRWFTLGDVGFIDEERYLHLVDRKSHMIITGGENVYPAEVEAALMDHPGIRDVAVVGAPDERWGETVVAVIVADDPAPTLDEIRQFLEGRLAKYKWPRRLERLAELPRTPSGKVQKHRIVLPSSGA